MSTTISVVTTYRELVGAALLTGFVQAKKKDRPSRVNVYTGGVLPQHFTSVQIRWNTLHVKRGVMSFIGVPWSGSTACKAILFYWSTTSSLVPEAKEYEVCRIERITWE